MNVQNKFQASTVPIMFVRLLQRVRELQLISQVLVGIPDTQRRHPGTRLRAARSHRWAQGVGGWGKEGAARLVAGRGKGKENTWEVCRQGKQCGPGGFCFVWETTGRLRPGLRSWG